MEQVHHAVAAAEFLAPDITARLIAGAHPPELNAVRLMRDTRLPLDWAEQRATLAMA